MAVQQIQLTSIEAKRYAKPTEKHGQVRIDHNSTVSQVQDQGNGVASVDFRYTASYGAIGIIRVEGSLAYSGDAKTLADQWQSTSQMPPAIASEIHTAVMRVCVPEAVGLAKNLQLPPPIPLPQVRFQEQGKQGAATADSGHSPEIA